MDSSFNNYNDSSWYTPSGLKATYHEFIFNNDYRTQHWPLAHTPWPGLALIALYVYFVKFAGPAYMTNRAPYTLRPLLLVYNFSMVALSAWMFYEFATCGWFTGYNYFCQPIDYSRNPTPMRMAWVSYVYFLSKFLEFFDTIFFVLRKKNNQVTFLHLFHHVSVAMNVWLMVHFGAGGHGTFHALINSAVHFVMYSYYGLSALGPAMQKHLWWKRYITQFQIVQFVLVFVHSFQIFFYANCNYPKWGASVFTANAAIFIGLFTNFYIQSYRQNKTRKFSKAVDATIGWRQPPAATDTSPSTTAKEAKTVANGHAHHTANGSVIHKTKQI